MTKRKLKAIKFPKPKIADDTEFVRTLVWVLEQARAGKVLGYAMVYLVDTEEDRRRTIEAATVLDERDQLHLLGAMRRMERGYMRRQWGEDE